MNVSAIIVTRGDHEARFWSKVEVDESGCWRWTGARAHGYGRFWAGRRSAAGHPSAEMAHRFAYELLVGQIPDGLEIDHLCRNRACVNPAHLEPVTRLINQRRGNAPMQAQRKQTHCKRGHAFDDENTYIWRGMRRCRRCQAADARRYRSKARAT